MNRDILAGIRRGALTSREFLSLVAGGARYLPVLGLGAVQLTMASCKKGTGSSENEPPPPPPPEKETMAGKIADVLNNSAVSNAKIEHSEGSATTDANGNYSTLYSKGTTPILTIIHPNFTTRQTFPTYGPDYSIIPTSFNMTEFDTICRHLSSGTERWSIDNKPSVWISTSTPTQNNTPAYFISRVRKAVNQYIPQITDNVLKNLQTQEGPYENVPPDNVIIVNYQLTLGAPGANIQRNANNIIHKTLTDFPALDAQGNVMAVPMERILHELGHAIGFIWITDNRDSIMFRSPGVGYSPAVPGQIDIENGKLLYNRPTKNQSPDNDPTPPHANAKLSSQTYEQAVREQAERDRSFSDPMNMEEYNMMGQPMPEEWLRYERQMKNMQERQRRELEAYESGVHKQNRRKN